MQRKRGRELVSFAVAAALLAMGGNAAGALSPHGGDASVHHVRISPDGERVLAIVSSPARQGLAVIELQSGELRAVLTPDVRNRVLDDCAWATNERIVCSAFVFRGYGGSPYPRQRRVRLVAVDADGSHPLSLLDRPPRLAPKLAGVARGPPIWLDDLEHVLVDPLLHKPDHVLVAAPREATPYTSVYRVNVRNGRSERVLPYQTGVVMWHTDWTGQLRVGTGWYEYGNELPPINNKSPAEPWIGPTAVAADATGEMRRVDVSGLSGPIGPRDLVGPHVLGFSRDGGRVYYGARVNGADRQAVWEADARTLKPLRRVAADDERDVEALAVGGAACGVVGFMHPLPGRAFTWLDSAFGDDVEAAGDQVADEIVAVPSMSADCRRVVLAASDGLTHKTFHLLDRADGTVRALGSQGAPVATGQRLVQRHVTYMTRDGRELPVALTLPVGGATDPPPTIMLIHGGASPDSNTPLNGWPAFFAARGYAVAEPAFRGASGYGAAFQQEGLRHRAAKLRDDVADALAYLDEIGMVDADRACFAGRGRGAHLALAAAADQSAGEEEPRARCAALFSPLDVAHTKRDHRAPYGLCSAYPCGDWMRWAAPHAWRRAMGQRKPAERDDANADSAELGRSPLVGADHPGIPILIQGGGKPAVHEKGSRRFDAQLRDLGFPEHVAPVGSAAEEAFLDAADRLFSRVLEED